MSEAYNVYLRNSQTSLCVEQHTQVLNSMQERLENSRLERIEELASNFTYLLELRDGNDVIPDKDPNMLESDLEGDEDYNP